MVKSIFTEGQKQDILAVLADKDKRVDMQKQLFRQFPNKTLLDVKLNIPGPIKNNCYLEQLFSAGITNLETIMQAHHLSFQLAESWDKPTGCENFYLLSNDATEVKQTAIEFEKQSKLTRLFDADVLVKTGQTVEIISRSTLKLPSRTCFLCNRPAKECARARSHTVDELQNYISKIFGEVFN